MIRNVSSAIFRMVPCRWLPAACHVLRGGACACLFFLILPFLNPIAFSGEAAGDGWRVFYNEPDGNGGIGFSEAEYVIKNAFMERIAQLGRGDQAAFCTWSFSGNEAWAGRMLKELHAAVDRGARIRFVADSEVDPRATFDSRGDDTKHSLASLAKTHGEAFRIKIDDSSDGIAHHKVGLFNYSGSKANGGQKYVISTSLNFSGASSYQWNIAVELQSTILHDAFSTEINELLAGRFHDHKEKSHAHDNKIDRIGTAGATIARVRFCPSPGPDRQSVAHMLAKGIDAAKREIVFGLNKLSDDKIVDALIRAQQRGVEVIGTVTASDMRPNSRTAPMVEKLGKAGVKFKTAWQTIKREKRDEPGKLNIVHTKYMVIDRQWVLHGSANWTKAALQVEEQNDENVLIIRDAAMAAAFLAQYKLMTE